MDDGAKLHLFSVLSVKKTAWVLKFSQFGVKILTI